jgi:hypothetical protein
MRESKPRIGRKSDTDFVAKARAAWGDALPDWVQVLAEEVNRTSGVAVADKLKLSGSLVSTVIAHKYPGDMDRVEQQVRGALMGFVVACPVLGEIGRDICLAEQKKPFSATSSVRSRLFRACRSGCPHSRLPARAAAAGGVANGGNPKVREKPHAQ